MEINRAANYFPTWNSFSVNSNSQKIWFVLNNFPGKIMDTACNTQNLRLNNRHKPPFPVLCGMGKDLTSTTEFCSIYPFQIFLSQFLSALKMQSVFPYGRILSVAWLSWDFYRDINEVFASLPWTSFSEIKLPGKSHLYQITSSKNGKQCVRGMIGGLSYSLVKCSPNS